MWPYMFSQLADEYDRRYGLDESHLRAIAELNMRNAKDNPLAQTRSWSFTADSFSADDTANPVVEGRLRRTDCGQVTDGTAGVVLVSGRFLAGRLGGRAAARIAEAFARAVPASKTAGRPNSVIILWMRGGPSPDCWRCS